MTPRMLNVGFIDRLIRGLLAIDLLALCLASFIQGSVVGLALMLAAYAAYSGLTGNCPVYAMLGLNTRQRTEP
ncbi:YgaP family membrane protein [Fibrella aquatilis]|uniref:DUF2892 domain-containing protein n=1 Tax=Fibrella aquatilis TaxID=2817059 RepID=A0A939GA86_9BACT|nr:DUF2892 domain-containing protein [Fibrella aquatilis]MBO0933165.1 DUF2892 domain-containing protein [Fibrella aquatilis]